MATSTYTAIATTTLASPAASYTFSSIPSTYTDLVLVSSYQAVSSTPDLALQFNGDTGTNYSWTRVSGTGSAANSARFTGQNYAEIDGYGYPQTSQSFAANVCQIMNYANTTTYKTLIARANSVNGVDAFVDLWRSTAAINSITIQLITSNINTGSTFTLYGVKAA